MAHRSRNLEMNQRRGAYMQASSLRSAKVDGYGVMANTAAVQVGTVTPHRSPISMGLLCGWVTPGPLQLGVRFPVSGYFSSVLTTVLSIRNEL